MAIAIALPGFSGLGRLQLSPRCPQMNKKNQCGRLKKYQDFCPWDIESCHLTKPDFLRFRVFFRACSLQNEVGDPPFFIIIIFYIFNITKGRTIRKVMGGGGGGEGNFQVARIFFFAHRLCRNFFFQVNPLHEFFFFRQISLFSQ